MNRPWIKLWVDKWLSSRRIRACNYMEVGLYVSVLVRAASGNEDGELRVGDRPWSIDDLAMDLGLDPRRTARMRQRLDRLVELGLLEITDDGAIKVSRFSELQSRDFGRNKMNALIGGLARKTKL